MRPPALIELFCRKTARRVMLGAMIPFIFTFYFGTLITGINPKTLQKIEIPAKTVVNFRIAKAAKNAILGAKKESGFRGRQRWESSL